MKQPRPLFLYAFTQMWESFSFYGMRALLVLYLIEALHYRESDAFALYALYTCLVEFGAFAGGYCADRFLGLRTTVLLGGSLIAVGHILLTFASLEPLFFLGLGAIVCGAMLFRSNLKALVGTLYQEADPRREAGFTYFYIGINMGGFVATLLCGYVASLYGWHAGFGLASFGMLLGMALFALLSPKQGKASTRTLAIGSGASLLCAAVVAYLLTHFQVSQSFLLPIGTLLFGSLLILMGGKMALRQIVTFSCLMGLLILYFTFEELMGSLLLVFTENQVDRSFLSWQIPSTMLSATNPLVIMVCGPLLSIALQSMGITLTARLALAYFCLTVAFGILYFAASGESASLIQMIASFAAIALGELFLAPSIFAYCSEISSESHKGMVMGVVTLAFALANLLSGQVSQLASRGGAELLPAIFLAVAVFSAIIFIALFTFSKLPKIEKSATLPTL